MAAYHIENVLCKKDPEYRILKRIILYKKHVLAYSVWNYVLNYSMQNTI